MVQPASFSTQHTQLRFLIITSLIEPQLWETLKADPYQKYTDVLYSWAQKEAMDQESDFVVPIDLSSSTMPGIEDIFDHPEDMYLEDTGTTEASRFRKSLLKWSRRWNLNAEWCRLHMMRVLQRQMPGYSTEARLSSLSDILKEWHSAWMRRLDVFLGAIAELGISPPAPDLLTAWRMEWLNQYIVKFGEKGPEIKPPDGFPLWDPDVEPEEEYLDNIEKAIQREIEQSALLSGSQARPRHAFVESMLKVARAYCKQVKRTSGNRHRVHIEANTNLVRNLVWAAQFQLQGMSYTEIAKKSALRTTKSTVMREVEKTLDMLDLEPREARRTGRPLGSRDSLHTDRQRNKR